MGLKRKVVPAGPPAAAGSLAEALSRLPEARQPYGWSPGRSPLPLAGMLQVAVAAMLCGARSLYAVAQWARERVEEDTEALVPLGLPAGRSPSVATLHRVFKRLDVVAFEQAVGAWLERTGVERVSALALDGKTLRGIQGDQVPGVHLVAAYAHEAGTVLAQVAAPGKGHELAAATTVLATVALKGRVVTADALLTQRARCGQIIEREGDDVLPVDANQPALLSEVAEAFSPVAGRAPRRDRRPGPPTLAERPGRADHWRPQG
jgi:DDE_Tnp_1-associated/Transposase DDE domain